MVSWGFDLGWVGLLGRLRGAAFVPRGYIIPRLFSLSLLKSGIHDSSISLITTSAN